MEQESLNGLARGAALDLALEGATLRIGETNPATHKARVRDGNGGQWTATVTLEYKFNPERYL